MYSCGLNESGQLGIDTNSSGVVDVPTLVNLPSELEFIMVKAGSRHSMVIDHSILDEIQIHISNLLQFSL